MGDQRGALLVDAPDPGPADQPTGRGARLVRGLASLDLLAGALYLLLAGWLTSGLWSHPGQRSWVYVKGSDEFLAEWQLANAAHALTHLSNPFFSTALNAPDGVNLAANANLLGLAIPVAPVTLLFGPAVAYAVLAVASLALTGYAWYWVLSRPLQLRRGAALVGGLLGGFSPLMVIETGGHQHVTAEFLIPLIAWRLLALARSSRLLRDGAILGLLIAWQLLIGEEVLLIGAIGLGLFLVAYAVQRPAEARRSVSRMARGVLVAALVTAVVAAVPLGYQFAGRQRFAGNPIDPQAFPADPSNYLYLPDRLPEWLHVDQWLAGWAMPAPLLGLPILLILVAFGWQLRRSPVFVSTLVVLVGLAVLSLGVRIRLPHTDVVLPGPWRLVARQPVFQWAIPYRLALLVVPAAGVLVAMLLDYAGQRWRAGARWLPAATAVAVALALVGLAPSRLPTEHIRPVPRFIADGTWRGYLPAGTTLATVPIPSLSSFEGMRWSAATGVDFAIPGGYFLGPSADGHATLFGAPPVWTTTMLAAVASQGDVWPVAPGDAAKFRADLAHWRVGLLVLDPRVPDAAALQATVAEFLGPGRPVSDVWLWDDLT